MLQASHHFYRRSVVQSCVVVVTIDWHRCVWAFFNRHVLLRVGLHHLWFLGRLFDPPYPRSSSTLLLQLLSVVQLYFIHGLHCLTHFINVTLGSWHLKALVQPYLATLYFILVFLRMGINNMLLQTALVRKQLPASRNKAVELCARGLKRWDEPVLRLTLFSWTMMCCLRFEPEPNFL